MISEPRQIATRDGLKLNSYLLENGSPVWIIVTHGLGEHALRHSHLFKLFSQYFSLCLYDLRGHGKSEGARANVNSFDDYLNDLSDVVSYLKKTYSMKRYMLLGHSMGGLITASYMQKKVKEDFYPEKVFLSSPAVSGAGILGDMFRMAPLGFSKTLASIGPSLKLKGMLDIKKLSHDPRVHEQYVQDPLNSLGIHSHLFLQILAQAREVFSKPLRVTCDLYVAIGSSDVLVHPKACIRYFKEVEKQANLFVVEGGYHELHNEIERYRAPFIEFLKKSLMDSIYT